MPRPMVSADRGFARIAVDAHVEHIAQAQQHELAMLQLLIAIAHEREPAMRRAQSLQDRSLAGCARVRSSSAGIVMKAPWAFQPQDSGKSYSHSRSSKRPGRWRSVSRRDHSACVTPGSGVRSFRAASRRLRRVPAFRSPGRRTACRRDRRRSWIRLQARASRLRRLVNRRGSLQQCSSLQDRLASIPASSARLAARAPCRTRARPSKAQSSRRMDRNPPAPKRSRCQRAADSAR